MIIKVINKNTGKIATVKCDFCGNEFERAYTRVNNTAQHFCNFTCRSEFKQSPNHCLICHKPKDNTFYDKSNTRPLCSKACYSIYSDKHYKQSVKWIKKTDMVQKNTRTSVYTYPIQGRLILTDYNLGVW